MRKSGPDPVDIDFRGNSLDVLSSFPQPVKDTFGFNLRRLTKGLPLLCKFRSMPSIGPGVYELKEQDESTWYRLLYLAVVDGVLYVLHCFEKDAAKTDRRDIEIAIRRLSEVRAEITQKRAKVRK